MAHKILMVCLGNICRSPMAEGILRHLAEQRDINLLIDSCGTTDYHTGHAPDERAIDTLQKRAIDISSLRARKFSERDFYHYDEIFVMDASNYNAVCLQTSNGELREKVKFILDESNPGMHAAVPDPYYGGKEGFEQVANLLENACKKIIDRLDD